MPTFFFTDLHSEHLRLGLYRKDSRRLQHSETEPASFRLVPHEAQRHSSRPHPGVSPQQEKVMEVPTQATWMNLKTLRMWTLRSPKMAGQGTQNSIPSKKKTTSNLVKWSGSPVSLLPACVPHSELTLGGTSWGSHSFLLTCPPKTAPRATAYISHTGCGYQRRLRALFLGTVLIMFLPCEVGV